MLIYIYTHGTPRLYENNQYAHKIHAVHSLILKCFRSPVRWDGVLSFGFCLVPSRESELPGRPRVCEGKQGVDVGLRVYIRTFGAGGWLVHFLRGFSKRNPKESFRLGLEGGGV